MDCYRAGFPFKTRLLANGGLNIPSGIHEWPHFICEACTVRSVVDRELSWSAQDTALLMFERVRTLDMLHKWAPGTHRTYHSKIRVFRGFERDLGVLVLPLTPLLRPPNGPSIPLMWAQERYSLYPARWKRAGNVMLPLCLPRSFGALFVPCAVLPAIYLLWICLRRILSILWN
jgi:hypothetical protein